MWASGPPIAVPTRVKYKRRPCILSFTINIIYIIFFVYFLYSFLSKRNNINVGQWPTPALPMSIMKGALDVSYIYIAKLNY